MTATADRHTVQLVVFDWAGTTVDHGCFAPVAPFVDALGHFQVPITIDEARQPMGLGKRDHLRALLEMPRIGALWNAAQGRPWTEGDVDRIYEDQFIPRQMAAVRSHCELVPGLLDTVAWLRKRKIKIGTSTGYFAEAAQQAWQAAAEQGYQPDYNVSPGEVATGRPAPWMIFRNMEALGVYPPAAVVKVGDTVPDIAEGLAAGAWSVGVTRTGSDVGLTVEQAAELPAAELADRMRVAAQRLTDAGAHHVIASVTDLPQLIERINADLAEGKHP